MDMQHDPGTALHTICARVLWDHPRIELQETDEERGQQCGQPKNDLVNEDNNHHVSARLKVRTCRDSPGID